MVFLIQAIAKKEWHRMNPTSSMWTEWQSTRNKAISTHLDKSIRRYSNTITEYLEAKFFYNQTIYLETDTDYVHLPSIEYVQQHYPELLV